MAARLSQSVASAEEFESRCSALADLLNCLNVPEQGGTRFLAALEFGALAAGRRRVVLLGAA